MSNTLENSTIEQVCDAFIIQLRERGFTPPQVLFRILPYLVSATMAHIIDKENFTLDRVRGDFIECINEIEEIDP